MQIIDYTAKTRGFQAMVPLRDGARLNTFVFLPGTGGPKLAGHPASDAIRHCGSRCRR